MDSIIVGIDVSKDRLDVAVRRRAEKPSRSSAMPTASSTDRAAATLAPDMVALEATGGFETVVAASLAAAGLPVVVVNPAQVRAFAKALGQRAKTDPIDAAVIAHFAEATKPEVRPLPDEATRLLADLVARRRQIVEMIVAERQREKRRDQPAAAEEHRPAAQGAAEGADQRRYRHRRRRARLAGLAREGGPARLRARHRPDHRPHADRRTARTRHARPPRDRRPRRPCALHPPVRPMARQELHRRRPRQPCAPPCSWAPWSPAGTTPS